jgi:metal-responsive CopG/Arc/MetJ family transcriptional regulator
MPDDVKYCDTATVSFVCPQEMMDDFDRRAKTQHVTRSEALRSLIRKYLNACEAMGIDS